MFFRIFILLLALPLATEAGVKRVDFSNYDLPLYGQIVERIKAKVLDRLGEGPNMRDRYFIIPFAYQNRGNDPAFSHSFISVIRVLADAEQPELTPGLDTRTEENRNFEAFTISWLPADFMSNPYLCVFEGVGSRLVPQLNTCPALPGRNYTLERDDQHRGSGPECGRDVGTLRNPQGGIRSRGQAQAFARRGCDSISGR